MIFDGTSAGNAEVRLYFASMGKLFRVIGIAATDEEANEFAVRKDAWAMQHGVIGVTAEGYPVIAEFHGEKVKHADN